MEAIEFTGLSLDDLIDVALEEMGAIADVLGLYKKVSYAKKNICSGSSPVDDRHILISAKVSEDSEEMSRSVEC